MVEEIHSQGKTVEDIAECLKHVPLHPQTISAIKSAHALGYVYLSSPLCLSNVFLCELLLIALAVSWADSE